MRINLHNKAEVFIGKNKFVFYNKIFNNVFDIIAKKESYFNCVAVGTGDYSDNEKTQKLTKFIKKYDLNNVILQNNIKNGQLFNKKTFVIGEELNGETLKEIAICDNENESPNIYNYITLISDDMPNGIKKKSGENIVINLYVNLDLENENGALLTYGNNPLLSLLLGEGLYDEIFAVRGNNFSDNIFIDRSFPNAKEKFLVEFSCLKNDALIMTFSCDLKVGEIGELVFVCGDKNIARINLLEYKIPKLIIENLHSKENNIIDLKKDIKNVVKVKDLINNEYINNYFVSKYSNNLSDKMNLNFLNIFNYQTPRFLSKDGLYLFFVKDDYVYGFANYDYQLSQMNTGNLFLQHIRKIISFFGYMFIVTKVFPYVHCYKIIGDEIKKIDIDLTNFAYFEELENLNDIDFTISNDDKIMMAVIFNNGKGVTVFLNFDNQKEILMYEDCLVSDYEFSYLLSVYRNNFCDACVVFVKGGSYSYDCRLVTHFSNKTIEDVASTFAYDITNDTKELYICGRVIVVEKKSSSKIDLYYYPNKEKYNLSLLQDEVDDYFSNNLNYLIQKYPNNSFKVFNLVGYSDIKEFEVQLSEFVDETKIINFEFMNTCLLIFLDDEKCPIVGLNLYLNSTIIENLRPLTDYEIQYYEYDKIGKNEGVKANFVVTVSL